MNMFSLGILRVKKLWVIIKHPKLVWVFLRYRVLAAVEHQPILGGQLSTIVDIGSNRGQFSLAALTFTSAKIYAFEPIPFVADVFKRVFANNSRVTFFKIAIGPQSGKMPMHISSRDDSSSLLPIGQNQTTYFPGTHEMGCLEIDISPLFCLISPVDIKAPSMLKLDVQGFEIQALKGCESMLEHFNFIYCECSFIELYAGQKLAHEVIEWLALHQFYVSSIHNISYGSGGQAIQADFLFKRLPN